MYPLTKDDLDFSLAFSVEQIISLLLRKTAFQECTNCTCLNEAPQVFIPQIKTINLPDSSTKLILRENTKPWMGSEMALQRAISKKKKAYFQENKRNDSKQLWNLLMSLGLI